MKRGSMSVKRTFQNITKMACATAIAAGALTAVASTGAMAATSSTNPYNLIQPGTLTVGMDLVFKPEMYLTPAGKPAGYDVALLDKLAAAMHLNSRSKTLTSPV